MVSTATGAHSAAPPLVRQSSKKLLTQSPLKARGAGAGAGAGASAPSAAGLLSPRARSTSSALNAALGHVNAAHHANAETPATTEGTPLKPAVSGLAPAPAPALVLGEAEEDQENRPQTPLHAAVTTPNR
jgi:hypothetical protein